MEHKILYYIDHIQKLLNDQYVDPVTFEVDPTNRCNLDCEFCFYKNQRRKDPSSLNTREFVAFIDELSRMGTKSITFTGGGEPLVHPDFNYMVDRVLYRGFDCGLISNGVLLHKVFAPEARFRFIRLSINAGSPEIYKAVTGRDYFDKVIANAQEALSKGAFVGWSYVVNETNKGDIQKAIDIAKKVGFKYVQFKPSLKPDGSLFTDYEAPGGNWIIDMKRYKAYDILPCIISHLIGVLGADSKFYYCCQYRGNEKFVIGSLKDKEPLQEIFKRRMKMEINVLNCPHCRGMNYAKAYKEFQAHGNLIFDHRNFL